MKKTMWIIAVLLSGLFVVEAEAAPAFQAAGTAVSGTGAVTPAWPAHAINDVALLFIESTGGQPATLSTPAGFVAVANSPQATGATTAGTQITVFWARATSAAMTAPTVADPGDHVYAQIITYRGVMNTGNPWDVTGGGVKATASTSVTVTGVTTTVANTLIVQAVARDVTGTGGMFSAETNASLTGILERSDAGTTSGNGGGFAVWDGVKATAGATGNTAATVTNSINAFLTIALIPQPGVATYYHDTTAGVNIGFDGTTNVTSGTNQIIPPIITASLITANTCTGNARSASHPTGLYTHSRWYLTTNYAVATNIAANPSGSARLRGGAATDTVIVRLYDYDPVTGAKTLIGSSPTITLTGGTTTTNYPYTISSALYTVPAGHRLMLQYDFNQPVATYNARVYCSATTPSYITVTESTATVAPDHIEIDYPAPPFSTCLPTSVTVYACANAACSSYYTSGASVTLSPGGNVVSIPSGSSSGSGTVFTATAGVATLSAVSVPAALGATTCKNTSTGTFNCSVNFSAASLAVSVPNLVSGNTVTGTVSGCTAQLPAGANSINFYTAYQNPASGTKQAAITNAVPTTYTVATSSPGTPISLNFDGASPSSSASFSLSYPDVGGVGLTAVKGSASGSASFIAVPHHFTLSNITCGNGSTYVGCIVTSPYGIPFPVPTNASGAAFMKAGNPFSITVTAYNSASLATPNFGKETPAESVNLTPAANMADLPSAVAGNLTGSFGAFSGGSATGNAFAYSEAGIMTLTPNLNDPDAKGYLSIGNQTLNPAGTASGNIGRFIPDHFTITTDPVSPIITQADFLPQTQTVTAAAAVGATTISVAATTGFHVGSKVRIPGAGAGGNVFTSTLTAVGASTLTLNSGIGTALAGDLTEKVIAEWGSYMGEKMNAKFTLNATSLSGATTMNYQGAYAKLNPTAVGNPLGLGAVDTAGPTYNLALDTTTFGVATGSFTNGNAAIIAPLTVTRGATAVGPYSSVKVGIAPTAAEADGVRMGAYDLGVISATADHTSIMAPLVQDVTAVRYGRIKLSNAYGSELLQLPITATVQYWDGINYVTSVTDSVTQFNTNLSTAAGNVLATIVKAPLALVNVSVVAPGLVTFANGVNTFSLAAPNVTGSVDLTIVTEPSYLLPSATATARATFGVYRGRNEFIYMRENY